MTTSLRTLSVSVLGLAIAGIIGLSGAASASAAPVTSAYSPPSDTTISLTVGPAAIDAGFVASSRGGWTWGGSRTNAE